MTRIKQIAGWLLLAALVAGCASPAATASPSPRPSATAVAATWTPSPPPTMVPEATATGVPLTATPTGVPGVTNAALSKTSFQVPLIVRHTMPDGAILAFTLGTAATGKLVVWPLAKPASQQITAFQGTGGEFDVQPLDAGSAYGAAVVLDGPAGPEQPAFRGAVWGPVTFHTDTSAPSDFTVAVIGDSGFGEAVTSQLASAMASFHPDYVLHTGDMAYQLGSDPSVPEGFASKVFGALAPLFTSTVVYPLVGNHDLEAASRWHEQPYYFAAFPPFTDPSFANLNGDQQGDWYAFTHYGIQFIDFNTQVFFGYPGRQDELAWLKARLQDPRFKASIVIMHVPMFNAGYHILDSIPVRSGLEDVLAQGHVPLVLAGHDHDYQRFTQDNRTYVVSGGGSGHLYAVHGPESGLEASATTSHFVLLHFTGDKIDLQAIDASGKVFDQASFPLAASTP